MSKDIPVEGWYLENRTGNHSKFYTVLMTDNGVVVTAWGRIGTAGQNKIQKFQQHADAVDVGRRQLYSKRAGGYATVTESFKFTATADQINNACERNDGSSLVNLFHQARRSPQFDGHKKSVMQHYDDFVKRAQALMDTANDRPFEEVAAEFQELKDAWAELHDRHESAAITVGLIEATMHQRLMSGAL